MAAEPKTVDDMTGAELDELAAKLGVDGWKKSDKVDEKKAKLRPLVADNSASVGKGEAQEGDAGTAPVGPDGAADGDFAPPSDSPDGAQEEDVVKTGGTAEGEKEAAPGTAAATPDEHPAVHIATQPGADPADANVPPTGDVAEHPLQVREGAPTEQAAVSQDAAFHGDTPEHPLPVRESADAATATNFEQDPDAIQPQESPGYPPVGKADYTRGFERGDLTPEQRKALKSR